MNAEHEVAVDADVALLDAGVHLGDTFGFPGAAMLIVRNPPIQVPW